MAKFLEAELVRLVKDVVRAEIPRDQRATPPVEHPLRTSTAPKRSPARDRARRARAGRFEPRNGATASRRTSRARTTSCA